jgi:hypothetical protein
MEHFIDDFSKRLGKAVSRRDVLSIAARTCFATLLTSTGIGKLWAIGTTTLTSSQVCPACGTCQQCNTAAGKCGQECENPCTTAVLCSTAQQFPPYVTLQSFLAEQFTSASEPQALVLIEPSVTQVDVLSTQFTGPDPDVSATLFFTKNSGGSNAYGVKFQNGTPQYGYFVGVGGQIEEVLPPYQVTSTALGSSAGSATEIPGTNTVRPGITNAPFASQTTNKPRCTAICELTCNAVFDEVCDKLEAAGCAEAALVSPIAPLICYLAVVGVCQLAGNTLCPNICAAECECGAGEQPCGSGCCGACQSCSNGQCVPMQCPAGYSCSSTTGTCTCDNFCGTNCCSSGQTCSNSTCLCAPGETPCGPTCCPMGTICSGGTCVTCPEAEVCGTTCCPPPGVCLNGTCNTSTCGSCATSFCGCGGVGGTAICCPSGYYCADPGEGLCCPDGDLHCCGTCCPAGMSCCCNNPLGNFVCCSPSETCTPLGCSGG